MSDTFVTNEEWAETEAYTIKLKELNAEFAQKNGRQRLVHTKTYGCQQNVNDTERIRGLLEMSGFGFTDDEDTADVVIYNTCAVRENAEQKVFGRHGL